MSKHEERKKNPKVKWTTMSAADRIFQLDGQEIPQGSDVVCQVNSTKYIFRFGTDGLTVEKCGFHKKELYVAQLSETVAKIM